MMNKIWKGIRNFSVLLLWIIVIAGAIMIGRSENILLWSLWSIFAFISVAVTDNIVHSNEEIQSIKEAVYWADEELHFIDKIKRSTGPSIGTRTALLQAKKDFEDKIT